ncbi:hypothetical protein J6590_016852 [Homalodisca vitripennis]|nr:hypothetical protein J6590_016852 [Homalodisca vitripennis]
MIQYRPVNPINGIGLRIVAQCCISPPGIAQGDRLSPVWELAVTLGNAASVTHGAACTRPPSTLRSGSCGIVWEDDAPASTVRAHCEEDPDQIWSV